MSREPQHTRVDIGGGAPSGKKPKASSGSSSRTWIYIVILVLAAAGSGYMWFGRGDNAPPVDPEATQKVTQIQDSQPAPKTTQPDLPIQGRAPRGHPIAPK